MVNSRATAGSPDLRQDPIPALIRKIAVPASTGMVFSTLLNVTDTWYAGMLSPTALAALSLAGPVFFLVMTLGIGMGQASNALVGNELGRDDRKGARTLALQAIGFATIVSLLGAALAFLATPLLFRLMGGEAPYLEPATEYMNVVLLGSAFFALSLVLNSILNTQGDTRSYRNAQIGAFVANLGLDPLFMFVLDLGVVGVAVATIIVQCGVMLFLFHRVFSLHFMRRPAPREMQPVLNCYRQIAWQSFPNTTSMLLVATGSLIIVSFVTRFGEPAMAAYSIALRIEQLILLPTIGLNIATLSMTSVNYGARRMDRVADTYRTGLMYAIALMLSGAAILLLFAPELMQLFTDDQSVQAIGITYLYFEAFILPAYALTFLSAALLQGLKRPKLALYFNVARQVIGQLLLFYIAVDILKTDITGIWWSVLIVNWVLGLAIVYTVLAQLAQLPPGAGAEAAAP